MFEQKVNMGGEREVAVEGWADDEKDAADDVDRGALSLSFSSCSALPSSGGCVDSPPGVAAAVTNVTVSIVVPDCAVREPVDICCVVDISGSMNGIAKYENDDGSFSNDGLSVLDVVKHAVKAVMHLLSDQDRLSIVAFNGFATTVLPLTEMTASDRLRGIALLEALSPNGSTDIWAGLFAGMETLRCGGTPGASSGVVLPDGVQLKRRKTLMLLTDGQPSTRPVEGHIPQLQEYHETNPDFTFQLNSFGFGSTADSDLLLGLSVGGRGTFSFIPDARIVGTCFVNCVANSISTFSQNPTLHLMARGGAAFAGSVVGDLASTDTSWGRVVSLGPVQFGQTRDIVVPMSLHASGPGAGPCLEAVVVWHNANGSEERVSAMCSASGANDPTAVVASLRCALVEETARAVSLCDRAAATSPAECIAQLAQRIRGASSVASDSRVQGMLADVDGRITKAASQRARMDRWGKHYLRALQRAHDLQICTNYMDPGLQLYGGAMFKEIQEEGGKVFLSIPPPTKSSPKVASTVSHSQPVAQTMNNYYCDGGGGGCFGMQSTVEVCCPSDGEWERTPVGSVQAGDRVRVWDGSPFSTKKVGLDEPLTSHTSARVLCAVKMHRLPSKSMVVLPGGLVITPGHPVLSGDGGWQPARKHPLAKEMVPMAEGSASPELIVPIVVFNFILDSSHMLLVNGTPCITWAHGLQEEGLRDPFYGTEAVLDALLQGREGRRAQGSGRLLSSVDLTLFSPHGWTKSKHESWQHPQ